MKIQSTMKMWRYGLMLVLLCIWNIPGLAVAGVVPPIPTGPFDANGQPATPDYYTTANWANSPPLAKFVDTLPGLGSGKANNLGQYLSVAKPDIVTYPGSDYYEINLVEYKEQMHSDLPNKTLLRGYVQVNKGTNTAICGGASQPACSAIHNTLTPDPVHYLGPNIVAQKDRPVRIKFTNRLPAGQAGDLFIPVDTSVMGAGTGPASATGTRGVGTPCDNTVEPNSCASYTQNRADLHLHGGRTPWISDGTPHQWITPVEEITPFTKGVSFQNVPDMPDPGDGSQTYYYTNQQSARLMFYHDHAFGITRLNVYAGEAAGYVLTDQYEQDLVTRGLLPADQIPLIIQDKTFVDATPTPHPVSGVLTPKVRITDPLWNWGSAAPTANADPTLNGARPPVTGDLWLPHVYMPAQTLAAGFGGVNPFGRWMYGPWFYPATVVTKGPVANPYYDADCSSPFPDVYINCATPGQPELIPGTPNTSMGMEAFQDSAVVNGTAFPSLTVDPRAYRFRILNAASDRFQNLSFYVADPDQISPDNRPASRMTEVKMVPAAASIAAANNWPADWPVDGRDGGVPDPGLCAPGGVNCPNLGPSFLQIATEGGFLAQPVVINPQPITYVTDPTAFWVGNVDKMGLALGPAERADVVVDFSAYAGKTLILYNDAPAAWPARVAGYDYYTGAPDLRDSGGYGTGGTYDIASGSWVGGTGPLVGYAPNTRTVMQVIVRSSTGTDPAYTFNQTNLVNEFTTAAAPTTLNPAPVKTLFERSQEPIIVGQAAYSTTYPNSYFPPNFPWEGIAQINDNSLQFVTLAGDPVVVPMEPKGIHDEMGASFDPVYGRMSGNLAMQVPNPTTLNALLILYGFADLPTETINNSTTVNITVVPDGTTGYNTVGDGTQIWNISHNGVDTHPIHFHIFDVQLINRVGWDGQILMPEPNELGWKDTVKISPLENTIVAVRPRAPLLPFGISNSLRPLNPAIPINSPMGFNSIDWTTGQAYVAPSPYAAGVTNILYNFGWEYVWHCHILSHEEMDMMRPIVLNVATVAPAAPTGFAASYANSSNNLTWTDPTPVASGTTLGNPRNEIGVRVQRCTGATCTNYATIATTLANATSYKDYAISQSTTYRYRLQAFNASGNSAFTAVRNVTTVATINPTVAITAPISGQSFTPGGSITINATATVRNGVTITNVQFFDGATLLATDTTAPYSFVWTGATAGAHSLTARVNPSAGAAVTSAAIPVTVTAVTSSITSPANNASFNLGVAIPITATATAVTNLTISQIEFYADGVLIGSSSAAPFTYSWTNATTGAHSLTVKAYYSDGAIVTSSAITVDVLATIITSPANASAFTQGAPIAIAANAAAVAGLTVNKVDFFADGVLIGTDTTEPYTFTWNGATGGIHSLTATATYSNAQTAASPAVSIVVLSTSITSPTAGSSFPQNVALPITVSVPTITGGVTVSKVDYFANGTLIGTSSSAPFTFNWVPLTPGAFNLTAISTFSNSATATSSAVAVTIGTSVIITAPVSGTTSVQGAPIAITATTNAPLGSSTILVEFFADGGTTPIGVGTTAPFNISWTNATVGVHTLTAKAYYSNGTSSTSVTVPISVVLAIPTTAPTAISPAGPGILKNAPFTFTAVSGATTYKIYYENLSGVGSFVDITAVQAGCASGTGICSYTLPTPFTSSTTYGWLVSAGNTAGNGPWSAILNFITAQDTPTSISPTGPGIQVSAPFVFSAVPGANGYKLYYENLSGVGSFVDITAAQAGCATGTGVCSYTLPTPFTASTTYGWLVSAVTGGVLGPWSTITNFITSASIPATPTALSPTGSGILTSAPFTFSAVAGATGYTIYYENLSGVGGFINITAAQAGCASGTGTCTYIPTTPFTASTTYGWLVSAQNATVSGPWSATLSFVTQ